METKLNSKHFFFKTRIPTFCCKIHISKFSIQTFCPSYLLTCYRYEWRKKRWRWWQCWPLQIESGKSVMVMCSCHLVIPEFHKFTLDNGTILWDSRNFRRFHVKGFNISFSTTFQFQPNRKEQEHTQIHSHHFERNPIL